MAPVMVTRPVRDRKESSQELVLEVPGGKQMWRNLKALRAMARCQGEPAPFAHHQESGRFLGTPVQPVTPRAQVSRRPGIRTVLGTPPHPMEVF